MGRDFADAPSKRARRGGEARPSCQGEIPLVAKPSASYRVFADDREMRLSNPPTEPKRRASTRYARLIGEALSAQLRSARSATASTAAAASEAATAPTATVAIPPETATAASHIASLPSETATARATGAAPCEQADPAAAADPDVSRVRAAGGPEDAASYTCSCGLYFTAPVSTTVCCPHCGAAQVW